MSRASGHFTQAKLAKALRGALAAGFPVGAVEIASDGTIRLEGRDENPKTPLEPFDDWKEKRHARPA